MNNRSTGKATRSNASRMRRFGVEAVVFPSVLMLVTTAVALIFVPGKYFSQAIIITDAARNNTVGAAWDALPGEIARLQEGDILDRVIDQLDLTEAYDHWGKPVSRQKAYDRLKGSLTVQEARDFETIPGWDLRTPTLEIGVLDTNARRAADIANAIVATYRDVRLAEVEESGVKITPVVIYKSAESSFEPVRPDLMLWLGVASSTGVALAMVRFLWRDLSKWWKPLGTPSLRAALSQS